MRRVLGEDHPDTLEATIALSSAYWWLKRKEEALALGETGLAGTRRALGEDHPLTLKAMQLLAGTYQSLGRFNEAAALIESRIASRRKTIGKGFHETLEAVKNDAAEYRTLGKWEEAADLLEKSWSMIRHPTVLGEAHPLTLNVVNILADTYHSMGRYNDSVKLQEQVVKGRNTNFGDMHPDTLEAMERLEAMREDLVDSENMVKQRISRLKEIKPVPLDHRRAQ
jgi:tetratricopeptide (TPR) repeat protein